MAELGLTRTALRLQLATLERDGHVARRACDAGRTKPAHVYELTGEASSISPARISRCLRAAARALASASPASEFDAVMRAVGRGLLAEQRGLAVTLRDASRRQVRYSISFGGLTEVEEDGDDLVIRSHGCPLAATAVDHPETCSAMESLVSEFVSASVTQRCDRGERPRCRFHIAARNGDSAA